MAMRGENFRFWLPVVLLSAFALYSAQKLVRTHLSSKVAAPNYMFTRRLPARRGTIYDGGATPVPLAKSVPFWEYRLDPVALTNRVVKPRGKPRRTPEEIQATIADALHIDRGRIAAMCRNTSKRYQFLAMSSDPDAHAVIADSRQVAGVAIEDRQVRQYLHDRCLSHVVGSVNAAGEPSAGIELKFNAELTGVPGLVRGKKNAIGSELYDKRIEEVAPIPGSDVYLTVDNALQYDVETLLARGVREFGAGSGWCVVLDAKTAAVLAMASLPDFHPLSYGRASDAEKINRTVNFTYEPGSVMKVITAATALDMGIVKPDTLYDTRRNDERYHKLPGDGSHVWEPRMTVADAIVHSSNIVIGKLGCDIGPARLWNSMRAFGFGQRTGVELPGEESGILRDWRRWDVLTWSRAPIGQGVSVTALQIACAYQAIANDGRRMKPHIVERIVAADGTESYRHVPKVAATPVSKGTARTMREIMLGVASPAGTARRAAIKGYSVSGTTGAAQKVVHGRYADGLYRATFCGIVPSGVVKLRPEDEEPVPPRIVVLVTLDFDSRAKYHQGGNSAAPVFRLVAMAALRRLEVEPDRPDELVDDFGDGELDAILDERARRRPLER